ncbi:hypothetical protein RhiirA5_383076 [Rhizophagus irregularis]|uniref:Uncharacterized protein n=1 Tax=Rhizophagus irregularis TaxID=588596 RepID=A0A2I1FBL6_9GLOM|nr:hypothetical protein RhiirA5_383076 [Rhizophagus irregularis]PKY31727.1 hypothetical protein RhiirB3_393525 [Rhizophagus irregularis]
MINEYYENTDKRNINNAFYKALKDVENNQTFTEEASQIVKELIKKKRDIKEISTKQNLTTMEADTNSSSTSKKRKIMQQSDLISLKDALSYIPPNITYSPYGTSSKSTTKVGGKLPKKGKDFPSHIILQIPCLAFHVPNFQLQEDILSI